MAAYNTPAGAPVSLDHGGDIATLVAVPYPQLSYGFTTPAGATPPTGSGDPAPEPPTTGQLWPRGNLDVTS